MVAIGKVVFTSGEHVMSLEPRGKGLLGITLRYPYEVRGEKEYFDDIPDEKVPKDMLDLAHHIVERKSGHFAPQRFEDEYENALKELLEKKQSGPPIERPGASRTSTLGLWRRSRPTVADAPLASFTHSTAPLDRTLKAAGRACTSTSQPPCRSCRTRSCPPRRGFRVARLFMLGTGAPEGGSAKNSAPTPSPRIPPGNPTNGCW
jgi:hypothetical protein